MTDQAVVLAKLSALTGRDVTAAGAALTLVHDGTPVPKERPRFNPKTKTVFTPTRTLHAQRDLLYSFRVAADRRAPYPDTLAMVALFYVPTRRRKDVDNLMKLVMDAATKARIWLDDSQVTAQASFLELDPQRPRTVVAWCPYVGSLTFAPLLTGAR